MTQVYGAPEPARIVAGIPADVLDELKVAEEFVDGALQGLEISAATLEIRERELAEATEALGRAQQTYEVMCRASDLAGRKFATLCKSAGVVRRADGFAVAPPAETGPAAAEIDPPPAWLGGLPVHQHHSTEWESVDCYVEDCDVYRIQRAALPTETGPAAGVRPELSALAALRPPAKTGPAAAEIDPEAAWDGRTSIGMGG
jgi:hypothetical protein